MGKIIELTHDDVQNELAYALICETMEGAFSRAVITTRQHDRTLSVA